MSKFKRALVAAAIAGAAIGFAGSANATTYLCSEGPGVCSFDGITGGFSNVKVAAGTNASDTFTFQLNITEPGKLAFTFTTANLTFGSFTFNGNTFTPTSGMRYDFDVATAGVYDLVTNASNNTALVASYSGTIDLVSSAVPEPAAWGMMIGGFAMGGAALRRRRSTTLATA